MLVDWLVAMALVAWLVVLLLPSRPWSTRERISPASRASSTSSASSASSATDVSGEADLAAVTVLIPARNEAASIGFTLHSLAASGAGLRVVVIDDQSEDETAAEARAAGQALAGRIDLDIVEGRALPEGWGGKLWALEQGLAQVASEYCLLLDAEIVLEPGIVAALLDKARRENRALVSVMARLRCRSFWERLLVPPFIFFFKLIYPFARVNARSRRTAAAAGGCILIRTAVLRDLGGFAAHRDALIDDCTLASKVKREGHAIWLGLSDAVSSTRAYADLASFRRMVTRTAFTQLNYSVVLLAAVAVLMLLVFFVPWLAFVAGPNPRARTAGALAVLAMAAAYAPTVRFYRQPLAWTLSLPLAALLFLGMTFESAVNYWRGVRAEWKGRVYTAGS